MWKTWLQAFIAVHYAIIGWHTLSLLFLMFFLIDLCGVFVG
jgi:hypothetical protein